MINPFKKSYKKKEIEFFNFLKSIKIFSRLSEDELALFIPHIYERKYQQNEVIFFRNDPSQALYLLVQGEVTISIDLNENFENINVISANNMIGESSLVKNAKRESNAIVTSENAQLYVIPQDNIFSIFESNLKIKASMMEELAEIFHLYNAKILSAYRTLGGFFDMQDVFKNV